MLVPSTGYQCQLRFVKIIFLIFVRITSRDLPDRRYGHSQAGLSLCGGGRDEESRGSCLSWGGRRLGDLPPPPVQEDLSLLLALTAGHPSHWLQHSGTSPHQRYHFGLVLPSNTFQVRKPFTLSWMAFLKARCLSSGCAIADGDSVILTGGVDSPQLVSRYNTSGRENQH